MRPGSGGTCQARALARTWHAQHQARGAQDILGSLDKHVGDILG